MREDSTGLAKLFQETAEKKGQGSNNCGKIRLTGENKKTREKEENGR